jgi:hypothetical protein
MQGLFKPLVYFCIFLFWVKVMEVSTATSSTCPNSLATETTHKDKVYPKDSVLLLLFACQSSFMISLLTWVGITYHTQLP